MHALKFLLNFKNYIRGMLQQACDNILWPNITFVHINIILFYICYSLIKINGDIAVRIICE